jgi:hypothetical protein
LTSHYGVIAKAQQSLSSPFCPNLREYNNLKKRRENIIHPVMGLFDKAYVLLMGATRKLQMIYYGIILNTSNTMYLKRLPLGPDPHTRGHAKI